MSQKMKSVAIDLAALAAFGAIPLASWPVGLLLFLLGMLLLALSWAVANNDVRLG